MKQTLQGFSQPYLASLFAYDRMTGLVTRRVRRGRFLAGLIVGTLDGKGYLHVNVDGVFIRLHRLIWFLETGVVPPDGIDHCNTIRTDNRWLNLRLANQRQNCGNAFIQSNNSSGYRGVSFNNKSGQWHAQIKINGKQTYVGRSPCKDAAALLYNAAARQHFGEFARLNVVGKYDTFIPVNCRDLFL